jgi:hypothetical protein
MALTWIRAQSDWSIDVIGGVAKPAIEGWILALRGVPGTDDMSRSRVATHLAEQAIDLKSTDHHVGVVDEASSASRPLRLAAGERVTPRLACHGP